MKSPGRCTDSDVVVNLVWRRGAVCASARSLAKAIDARENARLNPAAFELLPHSFSGESERGDTAHEALSFDPTSTGSLRMRTGRLNWLLALATLVVTSPVQVHGQHIAPAVTKPPPKLTPPGWSHTNNPHGPGSPASAPPSFLTELTFHPVADEPHVRSAVMKPRIAPVPAPGTLVLAGCALMVRRRRRSAATVSRHLDNG